MKKKNKKKFAVIFRILLTIILVLNIAIILMQDSKSYDFLGKLPLGMIPLYGSSMEPVLSSGDVILTVSTPFTKLKKGDIVVFSCDGDLIAHEIIEINGDVLTTKGTANDYTDSPVSESDYKARMLCSVPFIGALWRISSSPAKFVVFAILLTLLIFGSEVFSAVYTKVTDKSGKNIGDEAE